MHVPLFSYTNNSIFPALRRWEWQPLNFQDPIALQVLRVFQPSPPDIIAAIGILNEYITKNRDNKFIDIEKRLRLVGADFDHMLDSESDEVIGSESDQVVLVTGREKTYYRNQLRSIKLMESERDCYRRFLENHEHYLGEVVAGSGIERTVKQIYAEEAYYDSIADWALVRITPHRPADGNQASYMLLPL